jgi:hypothetical protein
MANDKRHCGVCHAILDASAYVGDISCTLATSTAGVLLVPLRLSTLSGIVGNGTVLFGPMAIQTTVSTHDVALTVACTSVDNSLNNVAALTFVVVQSLISVFSCATPPSVAPSQAILPPIIVGVRTNNASQSALCDGSLRYIGPSLTCNAYLNGGAVTGSTSTVNMTSSLITCASLSVAGDIQTQYNLVVKCSIGTISVPPVFTWPITISGCSAGAQPSGATCIPCPSGRYSDGGNDTCVACPLVGVSCAGGILKLLP